MVLPTPRAAARSGGGAGGVCWVLGAGRSRRPVIVSRFSQYLKKSVSNEIRKREKKKQNLPMAQEASNDASWVFFLFTLPPCWVLLISPSSRHSPVFSGLVAALPFHHHFEVAPIPTPRAVAR